MAKQKTGKQPLPSPGFEQSLAALEEIVHDLEEGQLGLEESLLRYEEGVKLLRRCHELLTKAQRRIELLGGVDAQGAPVTRSMEEEPRGLEEKAARRSRRRSAPEGQPETGNPGNSGEDVDPAGGPDDVDEPGRLF